MSHTERQDVTYYNGHVIEVNGKRYVPERTCHVERNEYEDFCSNCGCGEFMPWYKFCPQCGSQVKETYE